MDLFSPYVQFISYCVCGIPSICLEGHLSDWSRLREKLALLRGYDADDWVEELDGILAHFVDAAGGRVDQAWWQEIYKLTPRYGGEDIEGWLGAFFPYLEDVQGTFTRRRVKDEKFTTGIVPPGLSDVNVKFVTPVGSDALRVVSGFVGVEDLGQDGVRPRIAWAVVRNHFMESFLQELDRYPGIVKQLPPVLPESVSSERLPELWDSVEKLPIDLQLFYRVSDGADLFGKGSILPLKTLLNAKAVCYCWKPIGLWKDGSVLLAGGAVVRLRWTGHAWEYQTLGTSFSDFLTRLVAANGNEYWESDDFVEPEITPQWNSFQLPDPSDVKSYAAKSLELLRRSHGFSFIPTE
jgi:hypothetical protein